MNFILLCEIYILMLPHIHTYIGRKQARDEVNIEVTSAGEGGVISLPDDRAGYSDRDFLPYRSSLCHIGLYMLAWPSYTSSYILYVYSSYRKSEGRSLARSIHDLVTPH